MSNLKRHKIECIKSWINELTTDPYGQGCLKGYNGDELEKQSLKTLDMILNYIKASYHLAYTAGKTNQKNLTDQL